MDFFWVNIHFLSPEAFFLLVILLPLLIFALKSQAKQGIQASFLSDVKKIYGSSWLRSTVVACAYLLIIVTWVTALANPVLPHVDKQVSKKWIDIMLVMDISKSMLAEDITPNRLEAAKKTIDAFVSKRENDRIGIILFAGKPFASVPLTFDYDAVRNILSEATTDTIDQRVPGLSGTAIGDGILSATDMLLRNADSKNNRSKIIILLTDGEANVWVDPTLAAGYAKEKWIPVYTIGIGKNDGTPLYVTDDLTGKRHYFVDESGAPIIANIDEKNLKNIAGLTGGKFFLASDKDSLDRIFETLAKLNKTEITMRTTTTNESLTPYLIYLALLLFLIVGYHRLRVIH